MLVSCKSFKDNKSLKKTSDTDFFKNTMVESRFFTINASKDNILKSKKGNVFVIPRGSLIDLKGKIVEDSITIELAEASDLDEVILSNLMINDSSKIYESYQSFFFNATRKGKQLKINPDNPVFIEVPAEKQVNLYQGKRDKTGNMLWNKFLPAVKYLVPLPLESLDFYPQGFEIAVEKGLPYHNHKIVSKELLDSLYYSFAAETDQYRNFLVIRIEYLPEGRILKDSSWHVCDTTEISCGINPASIKAIKDKKYQNTLISTREFETRLKTIFKTGKDDVLELYVNNLNKNLWEIDEMAANLLGSANKFYKDFQEFSSNRQTTVKISDKKAEMLAQYYKERKAKNEKDIQKLQEEFIRAKEKHEILVRTKTEEYQKLLVARHSYRMQKFGFELTEFGWYNAALEIKLKDVEKFNLQIAVENGREYDRVYAYVVNPKIKSIFSYLSDDKINFNIYYAEDPDLLLWSGQEFKVVGVGYKNKVIGYKIAGYVQQPKIEAKFKLVDNTVKNFKDDLKTYTRGYRDENKIITDLEYQAFFHKEKKRKEVEEREFLFLFNLRLIVFPCLCQGWNADSYTPRGYMEKFYHLN